MNSQMIESNITNAVKYLFDEQIVLTGITEYGISWEEMLNGEVQIPQNGARFDITFEGNVVGDAIKGVIKGTDYLEIRTDGKFMLHIQARIVTDDGETIAVKETGISTPGDNGIARLNLNMDFYTSAGKYNWLNSKQVWAVGEVDMINGLVNMKGYSN
ncbi:MAG: DUF3237 family protein [Calditrichaeota bacterium]|nr:DUF3237 family protein [Calditrichota bacterium]